MKNMQDKLQNSTKKSFFTNEKYNK